MSAACAISSAVVGATSAAQCAELAADGGRLDLSQPMLLVLFDRHLVANALGVLKEAQEVASVRLNQ